MKCFNLTTPQKNIWNLQTYYENTAIANLCGIVFYQEKRDTEFLKKAVNYAIKKHTALRLQFTRVNGETMQYVKEYSYTDIPTLEFTEEKEFERYVEEVASSPIELEEHEMYRFVIVSIGEKQGILATLSHLIADAWTFSLIIKDVDEAYHRLQEGSENSFDNTDYTDFVRSEADYFDSPKYKKDETYWQDKYSLRPERTSIKPGASSSTSISAKRLVRKLSTNLAKGIQNYCKENSVTPAVLFETALNCYLYKINPDNPTVTIGLPILNRTNAREKNTAGMFISTLPSTIELCEKDSIKQLAKKITEAHFQLFRHQKYPFSMILDNLREKQNFEGNLYDVMFSFQNAQADTGSTTKWYSNGYSEVPFTLHVDNRDNDDTYTLTVDYQTEIFKEDEEIIDIVNRLEYIIEQILENKDILISDISIIPDNEKYRLLFDFNNTSVDYPKDKCVHELFMEQARKTPDAVAVVFENHEITYRELDEMSNVLAHILREKGVSRGDIVPIIAQRSWHILVAMLGVLKAGAGYMPIAPDYPKDRVQFIINEARSKVGCALGYEEQLEGIEILKLDELSFENAEEYVRIPVINQNAVTDVCYVIFTSGSTGVPKGVKISHNNLTNFIQICEKNYYQSRLIKNATTVLATTNFTFDISIFEIVLPLLNGLKIIISDENVLLSGEMLGNLIFKHKVDALHITATKIKHLLISDLFRNALQNVKVIMVGGEAFPIELFHKLKKYTQALIYNGYGPTETTIGSSFKELKDSDITIGKPIANTQIYILDKYNKPVPIGIPGELCIAGDGVGLGYLNRPDLTAEKFVPNPFATDKNGHGKTMYHTGDLATWRENGDIEYLGRIDTQVKIRGLRIELGEIESVMAEFPGIRMCAVTDKKDTEGRLYLVGYYTTVSDEDDEHGAIASTSIDERSLRQHLQSKLPKYMVPNYFMHLSQIPMTPSGKTDRKNLPMPEITNNNEELKLPQNDIEERILAIWKEELHTENLGCNQDFFEVGGDSLLAIGLLTRLEKAFDVRLQMKDIFENRSVEKQAIRISENSKKRERIACVKNNKFLLTPQQKAVYLASQKAPESLLYNMPAYIPLPDTVNRAKLTTAIQEVFQKFQILRMKINQEAGELFGVIDHECELCIENYSEIDKEAFVRPFDLIKAPLFRIGFSDNYLLIDMHHIISDGTSLQILIKVVQATYEGKNNIQELAGYSDYAEYLGNYLKSEQVKQGLQWYRDNLFLISETVTFPKVREQSSYEGENYYYHLSKKAKTKEKEICNRYQITETILHMATYALLLKSYSGLEKVPGSIVVTNRQHFETEHTLGMFVNTLPIVWSFEKRQSIKEYLKLCKDKVLKLYEYEEIPFETIIENIDNVDATLFNTSFVYQANTIEGLELAGQKLVPKHIDTHTSKFDLTVEVISSDEGELLRLEYRTSKIDKQLAERMAKSYESILLQLTVKEYVDEITALTEEEEKQVLYDFNNTKVDYPRDKCVHELFMEQAQKTPDAVAVVFKEKSITYRELDEMSNILANFLVEHACTQDSVIPIIATRSYYIIIAMLGILKAGGAYLLLLPDYPLKRIKYMVDETNCKIVLTNGYKEKLLEIPQFDIYTILKENKSNRKIVQRSNIACIIHTSGTTGNPKLSMLSHKNMMNYIHYIKPLLTEIDCSVSYTLVVFDAFHLDGFIPMLLGKKAVIASENQIYNQASFENLLAHMNNCMIFSTPTKWTSYIKNSQDTEVFKKIKMLVLGGEVFGKDLYNRIAQIKEETDIYNMYGPTETCINSTHKNIVNSDDITIGKPIANTQIYILDKQGNPVPIGVPGELCIAGDGVGLGYLNRPDLTAERFVPNPFATDENGHGKIMYHTGDLAAWRENGEIEYLGRIDTQVKIRGLRIELGEIESVMAEFPGIRMCAVTDKKDAEGRQYLVGYYTTVSDEPSTQDVENPVYVDESKLRQHLLSKLPKYMVPNYFMHLSQMPMTPSGKTDRKNLPIPEIKFVDLIEYVAPITAQECTLCKIMEEVLNYSPIGLTHDFFSCGGDSLKAMEFVVYANSKGINFKLQDIFEHPTVNELSALLQKGTVQEHSFNKYTADKFAKYTPLLVGNIASDTYEIQETPIRSVLLTGITGFLGAHIADALLQDEKCVVYCLVRSKMQNDRRGKFPQILEYYFGDKYKDAIGTRIIPIVGDITDENLSDELPEKVDMIIHSAATVKHYGSYDYFYKVNTLGTKHMADYALRIGARFIHISTISVSGNSLADNFDTEIALEERYFGENCLYQEQSLSNVYVRSKFEAECIVLDAMLNGLQANIIRVGNLTNRSKDYVFQPNYAENAFLSRIKAALELGCLPDYMLPLYSEFSPIDDTADAIVRIAKHFNMSYTVFHVYSNQNLYFDRMLEILKELSIDMNVVDGETFAKRLKESVSQNRAYIYEAFLNDMGADGKLNYETNIHIQNDFTLSYLKQLGFEWTKIDYKYVKGYIEYFKELGYLEVDMHKE